jgi:hypothetical protein
LAVNALSADVGYRGAAAAVAFAAILLSTNWLRGLPPRAPLVRMVSGALVGGAAVMVLAAVIIPRWGALATIVATGLTTAAVLIQTDLDKASGLLFGVAFIGGGVAVIGVGVAVLRGGDVLVGVAVIGGGVAVIGVGVAVIGVGVAILRRIGLVAHAVSWLVSLTQDPGGKVLHHDDPALSEPDNPAPGNHPPTSEPPPIT